jgi:diaminopimelate epimerase
MPLKFTKMHGLGNDFVVIDKVSHPSKLTTELVRSLGDRHFGIGFDQLLVIEPPTRPDVEFDYRIFNCDGLEVEHCGNGARCFARYVIDKGLTVSKDIRVKTANGIIVLTALDDGAIRVDMGAPSFDPKALPFSSEKSASYERTITRNNVKETVFFYALSVGNPHAVILVDDVENTAVREIGTEVGKHPDFPKGVNVGFLQILDRDTVRLRVFERGAGETIACGTGACAAVCSAIQAGLLNESVTVHLSGGDLRISWAGGDTSIMMVGPATTVFEGTIDA